MKKDKSPRKIYLPTKRVRKGLLVIKTGNGKGKSSAAFGMIFRALGRGMRVAVVQFIKGKWISGEIRSLETFRGRVTYHGVGEDFTWNTKSFSRDRAHAKKGWQICERLLKKGKHHVYLFDEILYVLAYNFLPLRDVINGLKKRKGHQHVILTGRHCPKKLIQMADLVTEMREIKHPFRKGILAQPGIDY
jgi:cob(I)alamin adenosyltransferase